MPVPSLGLRHIRDEEGGEIEEIYLVKELGFIRAPCPGLRMNTTKEGNVVECGEPCGSGYLAF